MSRSSSSQGAGGLKQATAILSGKEFLSDAGVDAVYGIPRKTLQNWRVLGRGPKFRKFGSGVRYQIADVEAWIASLPTGGDGVPSSALKGVR